MTAEPGSGASNVAPSAPSAKDAWTQAWQAQQADAQKREGAIGDLTAQPDERTVLAPDLQNRANDASALAKITPDQYKPSWGQRIMRG